MLYVVPSLALTVAVMSDDDAPAGETGHRNDLHRLMTQTVGALQSR
jgi:hypothetical protein